MNETEVIDTSPVRPPVTSSVSIYCSWTFGHYYRPVLEESVASNEREKKDTSGDECMAIRGRFQCGSNREGRNQGQFELDGEDLLACAS